MFLSRQQHLILLRKQTKRITIYGITQSNLTKKFELNLSQKMIVVVICLLILLCLLLIMAIISCYQCFTYHDEVFGQQSVSEPDANPMENIEMQHKRERSNQRFAEDTMVPCINEILYQRCMNEIISL